MTRGLLAVGGYGLVMVAAGVLVVAGPGEPAAQAGPAGRLLTAAPVVPPRAADTPSAPTNVTVRDPAALEEAEVGRAEGLRDPFRPDRLVLWDGDTAPVVPADVRSDGSLVVPDDPGEVGWWTGGAQAGDAFGHVVIAGHIDSARLGIGILADLVTAKKGQLVTLRAGDRRQRYRVAGRREIKKADLAEDPSIFAQDAAHRLVLITCGGRFDPVRHRYDDNIVVEAVPV